MLSLEVFFFFSGVDVYLMCLFLLVLCSSYIKKNDVNTCPLFLFSAVGIMEKHTNKNRIIIFFLLKFFPLWRFVIPLPLKRGVLLYYLWHLLTNVDLCHITLINCFFLICARFKRLGHNYGGFLTALLLALQQQF